MPADPRVSAAPALELPLGHRCTNRCVFCPSGRANEAGRATFVARKELVRALNEGAARGTRRVVLLGGEPTIHPNFFAVLAEAIRLPFEEVEVFTNGTMLTRPGFLDRVAQIGRISWRVSIQGADAAVHDAVTQRRGSFDRLARGLDLLEARGEAVTVNTCATARNVDSLPRLADLADRYPVAAWHVDAVRPDDMGDLSRERLEAVLVPYARLAGSLRRMLAAFTEWNPEFDCSVGGVPFCLLPEWGHRMEHGGHPTLVQDVAGTAVATARDKYSAQLAPRVRTARCEGCAFEGRCSGVPALYLEVFGDAGIGAVSLPGLAAIDRNRANLPLLISPWLHQLLKQLPAAWEVTSRIDDTFQRIVEISLRRSDGARAALRVLPPLGERSSGEALRIDTPECTLLLTGDSGATELHGWLRGSVAAASPRFPTPDGAARPRVARIDVKLGFACNNRCEFCVQGNKRELYEPRSLEQLRADLGDGLRRGADSVVFTGGEPTLQPTLLEGIRSAASLGYRTIQVQSNGRMFAHREFCEEVTAAGANEFGLSLHGAVAATHDRLTRAPGSFRQTVCGIHNLARMGQRVLANTVITSINYRELPDIARLLVGLGVSQYQFAFVHILGTAAANASWVVPLKSDVMPLVRAGLDIGLHAGVRVMTEAIPFCLMQGYEECVAEQIIPRTTVFDAEVTVDDYTEYRLMEGKAKGPACGGCAYFRRCEGPWVEYPARFGWGEFHPVSIREAEHAAL